jgi:uncharacterized membrane protein
MFLLLYLKISVLAVYLMQAADRLEPGEVWPYVAEILIGIVLPFLVTNNSPIGAVRLIDWAKKKLGWSGKRASWLAFGLSILIAALIALADGVFNITDGVTPTQLLIMVGAVFGGTQYWFNEMHKPQPAPQPLPPANPGE